VLKTRTNIFIQINSDIFSRFKPKLDTFFINQDYLFWFSSKCIL